MYKFEEGDIVETLFSEDRYRVIRYIDNRTIHVKNYLDMTYYFSEDEIMFSGPDNLFKSNFRRYFIDNG